MTKLNMTSELSPTCGFRKPDVRKNFLENKYEREKGPSLQFRKLYDCTWVVTTDFYSINLVEEKQTRHREILYSFMTHFIRRCIKKIRMRSNIH